MAEGMAYTGLIILIIRFIRFIEGIHAFFFLEGPGAR